MSPGHRNTVPLSKYWQYMPGASGVQYCSLVNVLSALRTNKRPGGHPTRTDTLGVTTPGYSLTYTIKVRP